MSDQTVQEERLTCVGCGFEAPVSGEWEEASHPQMGTLTKCPGCGSTDVHNLG